MLRVLLGQSDCIQKDDSFIKKNVQKITHYHKRLPKRIGTFSPVFQSKKAPRDCKKRLPNITHFIVLKQDKKMLRSISGRSKILVIITGQSSPLPSVLIFVFFSNLVFLAIVPTRITPRENHPNSNSTPAHAILNLMHHLLRILEIGTFPFLFPVHLHSLTFHHCFLYYVMDFL